MTNQPLSASDLEAELAEVHATLFAAADELGMPLGELVRSQIKRSVPLLRAAVILTIAVGAEADAELRQKRVLLAGALEMLHVAMHIHRLLLGGGGQSSGNGEPDQSQDRSFMGGAILAGDYCFSRAAQMAARTDNPRVVRIFAKTLQTVSEGQLRRQFETSPGTDLDEQRDLLESGAAAAAALIGLDDEATRQAIALGQAVAARWRVQPTDIAGNATDTPDLVVRRQALLNWLAIQHVNGKVPPAAPSA